MKLNKNLKFLIFLIIFSVNLTTIIAGYVYPYSMYVDSVENGKDCLIIEEKQDWSWQDVPVINNCSEEFYLYDNESNINQNIILSNQSKKESFKEECIVAEKNYYEDSKGNSYIELNILDKCKNELIKKEAYSLNSTYRTSEIIGGKVVITEHTNPEDIEYQINQHSLELVEFYSYSKSTNIERKNRLTVPQESFFYKTCDEDKIILNESNICENKKYLKDKIFWEVKLYSISEDKNITIKGHTVYDGEVPLLDTIVFSIIIIITYMFWVIPFLSVAFLLFSLTIYLLKKYSRNKPKIKIPKWLNWVAGVIILVNIFFTIIRFIL